MRSSVEDDTSLHPKELWLTTVKGGPCPTFEISPLPSVGEMKEFCEAVLWWELC